MNDSIAAALASLVGDAQAERPREPSHSDLAFLIRAHGLEEADPAQQRVAGKTKRVRTLLYWALEHDKEAGERLVAAVVSQVRGKGGFRPDSPNFVGADSIKNLADTFRAEGYELTPDGVLRAALLDGLSGAELTEALNAYVRRATTGAGDAALVTGSGKDLLEAVLGYILTKRHKRLFGKQQLPKFAGGRI